jgi:monothiol glutaredoxin
MSDVQDKIRQIVADHEVVLFMKGSAEAPLCGFSKQVVLILDHIGVNYTTVDVLADQEVREGVKIFSDWPTIPQLYVKGEFVGGCDIVREMFQTGELKALLDDKGVAAA